MSRRYGGRATLQLHTIFYRKPKLIKAKIFDIDDRIMKCDLAGGGHHLILILECTQYDHLYVWIISACSGAWWSMLWASCLCVHVMMMFMLCKMWQQQFTIRSQLQYWDMRGAYVIVNKQLFTLYVCHPYGAPTLPYISSSLKMQDMISRSIHTHRFHKQFLEIISFQT